MTTAGAAVQHPHSGPPRRRAGEAGAAGIRVLSLWQPWATLWVAGAKLIETRSWGTSYRGRIAVHAGKSLEGMSVCYQEPFAEVLAALGYDAFSKLPRGGVIGVVNLVDCKAMGPLAFTLDGNRLSGREIAFGRYAPGRFAWITGRERTILAEPIPVRGTQGLGYLDAATIARLP